MTTTRPRRRPERMLLIALAILAATLVARGVLDRTDVTSAAGTAGPAPAPVELSAPDMIERLQARLRANPDDTSTYAQLGLAYLQRVRETADASYYAKAEAVFQEALKRDPQQLDALIGMGSLALSRHQFAEALEWGARARAANPDRAAVYGIVTDAQVELGRYDEAVATLQHMVDLRPDLASYSRVSYLRELHGDTPGAILAMQQAVAAGAPTAEGTLWAQVQLGQLYFNSGDFAQAEHTYRAALAVRPDYLYARAGLARLAAAQGHTDEAIATYREIVQLLPLPEFVIALGELYEVTGHPDEAQRQYDLVRAIQLLNASAGVNVDLELALFDAEHGADPVQALARARAAYVARPSLHGADALAWALYHTGAFAEARRYSDEALRLGTRDAALTYRAGMIAYALGDRDDARAQLRTALAINPAFSILRVQEARALLAQLEK